MKKFWKPRSINIVDVIIILAIAFLFIEMDDAKTSIRSGDRILGRDLFRTYEQVQEIKSVLNME